MQDRPDPHALERAFDITRPDTPAGISPDEAVAEISKLLASIGDTCPGMLAGIMGPARDRVSVRGASPPICEYS